MESDDDEWTRDGGDGASVAAFDSSRGTFPSASARRIHGMVVADSCTVNSGFQDRGRLLPDRQVGRPAKPGSTQGVGGWLQPHCPNHTSSIIDDGRCCSTGGLRILRICRPPWWHIRVESGDSFAARAVASRAGPTFGDEGGWGDARLWNTRLAGVSTRGRWRDLVDAARRALAVKYHYAWEDTGSRAEIGGVLFQCVYGERASGERDD